MRFSKPSILLVLLLSTAACSKGGNLVLEPGGRQPKTFGVPTVRVNQGGKAVIIQTGGAFTTDTGVHATVSVQAVSAQNLSGAGGVTGVITKVK
jgi:hypothetical protein